MHVSLNTSVRNCTKSQQMSHFVKYFLRENVGCKDVCCHSCLCVRLISLQLGIRWFSYITDQNVWLSFALILKSDSSDQIGEEPTTSLLHMSLKRCVDNTRETDNGLKSGRDRQGPDSFHCSNMEDGSGSRREETLIPSQPRRRPGGQSNRRPQRCKTGTN